MNLENLFEFNASDKDSRYQGYMRRVAKIAQQNFPGSATPEEAMALLLLKKEEENAEKIDTVDKINDQQERRVSALQRTNRSLERELENITSRLDDEQATAAGRGVPRELEQKINTVLQQQDQAIAADKADIEKLEQQMKSLSGMQVGRTGTEDQQRIDKLTQQIDQLKKQPQRDPKVEREIELKTQQLEKLQQELAAGQEKVGLAGKDVSAKLQTLGQQQQELEKQQQQLIQQQQELEKATQERIKKAAIAAGRRGTPADYRLSKKRLDALEPKVDGIEEKIPLVFSYVDNIIDTDEDQWTVIKNNSKSIEDLSRISNQIAASMQPRANLGESESAKRIIAQIQMLTDPMADYIERNYPNEIWLKKTGRGSLELEIQKRLYREYLRTNDQNVLRDENKIKAVIQTVVGLLKKRWDMGAVVGQDPRQGNLFDQPPGKDTPNDPQGKLFERPSLKDRLKEATEQAGRPKTSLDESLLDLFQARLLKSSAGSNGEVPQLDYQGHAVPDELSSEESPVVDLEVQMQDPDSPGAQGLQNLGQPWDRQKSFVLPKNDLDQNLREERLRGREKKKARRPQAREDLPQAEPGQASPVISYDRQMEDPISPGARGDYNWGRPHHQFKHREDVRESITVEVDEDITEVYEATKSTKTRNPVARAAQRVARGSGRHGSKKDYQRQPKHRGRS